MFLILIPLLFFSLVEVSFRLLGYKPRGSYLKKVDRLIVLDYCYLDKDGIYKANPNYDWGNGIVVNESGFRSLPFTTTSSSNQSRIAIISDSFGWGASAVPIKNAFPDLLQTNKSLVVFNLSSAGAGPEEYALVARKYIPILKPDLCAVFIYLGNDINLTMSPTHLVFRKLIEKEWYATNAGVIGAFDPKSRRIVPPDIAYKMTLTIPIRAINLFRESAFGTQLVSWLYNIVYKSRVRNIAMRRAVNGELIESLEWINNVCQSNNLKMIVFPIPVNPLMINTRNSMRDNECLFDGFTYYTITNLNITDYAPFPDDHFNNKGHAKMKDFVEQVLEKELYAPQ